MTHLVPLTITTLLGFYNSAGSTTAPAVDNTVPGVGRIRLQHATCTGTLIHPRVVLSNSCVQYPETGPGAKVSFTKNDGSVVDSPINAISMVPSHSYANASTTTGSAVIETDLALILLESSVDPAISPIRIGSAYPSNGSAVTSYGYGGYGTTSCDAHADSKKRRLDWTWGAGPYRVCGEDAGAPVLLSATGGPQIVATIAGPNTLGNVLYHREYIYEQIRRWLNAPPSPDGDSSSHMVSGVTREGLNLGAVQSVSSPNACQDLCLADSACKAWSFSGTSCQLKSFPGRWVPTHRPAWSGLRPLVDFGRTRGPYAALLGGAVESNSAFDCAARCLENSSCQGWRHRSPISTDAGVTPGQCQLYSGVGQERQLSSTASSGLRPTTPADVNLAGGTYRTVSGLSNANSCATTCAGDGECVAFTFTSSKSCELKNIIPDPVAGTGYTSNFKRAMTTPGHDSGGGTTIENWGAITPALSEVCRTRCESNTSCKAYTYNVANFGREATCTLRGRSSARPFTFVPNDGFVSGFKSLLWQ
jgi:V8-like Glu-specific endopeptidase